MDIKAMCTKIKIAWDYFLHYPDKTQVIVQVYILNPFYKGIETIVFSILNIVRRICLFIMKYGNTKT